MSNWRDKNIPPDHVFVLSSQSPKVLYIPPGYANGFKTLEEKIQEAKEEILAEDLEG